MSIHALILCVLAGILLGHTLLRVVSKVYKFPIPWRMVKVIDHPLRHRWLQPPDATAVRHGLESGMEVLEVGPGNGTYTLAAVRRLGPLGRLIAVDIEPRIVERLREKAVSAGIQNLEAHVADVHALPFPSNVFDAVFMMAVIGEIPNPGGAMEEFYRVLKPSGRLVFSEFFIDPDYPLPRTLIRKATDAGFRFQEKIGNFLYYTLIFVKP